MTTPDHIPGQWPELTDDEYRRLVRLAKRRLVGHHHHAEDVVSRAIIRWRDLPAAKQGVARIEQIIKSEAYSLLRSEHRSRLREQKSIHDRSSPGNDAHGNDIGELGLVRQMLADACRQQHFTPTVADIEVIELLFAGYRIADIVRVTGLSRYEVKRSRERWRRILHVTNLGHAQPS